MSGSLGGGRSQRQQLQADNMLTNQQNLLQEGLQAANPTKPTSDSNEILKLLEKYWKAFI